LKPFTFALGFALTLAQSASAASLTFFHDTAPMAAPNTDYFTLRQFDTSLGTLDSIVLDVTGSATASIMVFNSNTGVEAFTAATASLPFTVTGPGPTIVISMAVAGPLAGTAAIGINNFGGNIATFSNSTAVAPANYSLYEGAGSSLGSFSAVTSAGNYAGSANSGVLFGGSATIGGRSSITYTYTPLAATPEVGSMLLLGSALLGLGAWKRLRNNANNP